MAQESHLGPCILTPQPGKRKPTAKRTGNLFPVGYGEPDFASTTTVHKQHPVVATAVHAGNDRALGLGDAITTLSTSNGGQPYVAPMAKMESSQKRRDREAALTGHGKGKGRATSPASKGASSPIADNGGVSTNAEPLITSDIVLDPQQKRAEEARRYQEEVDRYESQRDREDGDFCDPGSQEDDSQTQRLDDLFETPRRRSRRAERDSTFSMQPLQEDPVQDQPARPKAAKKTPVKQKQPQFQQKQAQQSSLQRARTQQTRSAHSQQQSESRKRKADAEIAMEHRRPSPSARAATSQEPLSVSAERAPLAPKSRTPLRHNNKPFAKCKIESQSRRLEAVKTIRKFWSLTDDRLKQLPFAPRITTEKDKPIMAPLDWNSKLLEAVVQLATITNGDFPRACIIADGAFKTFGQPCGAKQLTDEIVLSALAPQEPASGRSQATACATPVQQFASGHIQSASGSASIEEPGFEGPQSPEEPNDASRHVPSRQSLIVKLRVDRQDTPPPAPLPAAAYPSPPPRLIKSEHVVPIMQRERLDDDESDSSGSEGRGHLDLESRKKIFQLELAIIEEKIAIKKRKMERKAARARQPGSSVNVPLLV